VLKILVRFSNKIVGLDLPPFSEKFENYWLRASNICSAPSVLFPLICSFAKPNVETSSANVETSSNIKHLEIYCWKILYCGPFTSQQTTGVADTTTTMTNSQVFNTTRIYGQVNNRFRNTAKYTKKNKQNSENHIQGFFNFFDAPAKN